MQALHEKYKNQGVVVLGVSIDQGGIDNVKNYVNKMELTFPNLHDPKQGVGREYKVRGVPMTYIINKDGKAIGTAVGPRHWDGEEIDTLVQQLLAPSEGN